MVRSPYRDDVDYFVPEEQIGLESENVDYFIPENQNIPQTQEKSKHPARSTLLWNAEKKRPQIIILVLLVVFTLIFLSIAIVATINSFHTIEMIVEYPGSYYGHVEYGDDYDSFGTESGRREFSYSIREGITVTVSIRKYVSDTSPMNIEVYDNGKLVLEVYSDYEERRVAFDFVVGIY
jgi:hypothetical protein